MSSPERREEARHLDDDELAAIWARYSALHDIFEGVATTYPDDRLAAARDVAALVGEVARLRAALGRWWGTSRPWRWANAIPTTDAATACNLTRIPKTARGRWLAPPSRHRRSNDHTTCHHRRDCTVRGRPDRRHSRSRPLRNTRQIAEGRPDRGIAFHPDLSRGGGTAVMVRKLRRAGLPVLIVSGREGA